jgi:mRNA interferase MazF
MGTTKKNSVAIPAALFNQAEILAQKLGVSPDRLCELALEQFISNHANSIVPDAPEAVETIQPDTDHAGQRVINQGDLYWVQLDGLSESEPAIPHPYVVIQENIFNHSRIPTVIACALTSNLKRASLPGNVLLEAGEANLPRQSVVEASKVSVIEKVKLGEYIGSLTEQRVYQILAGIRFLQASFFPR